MFVVSCVGKLKKKLFEVEQDERKDTAGSRNNLLSKFCKFGLISNLSCSQIRSIP